MEVVVLFVLLLLLALLLCLALGVIAFVQVRSLREEVAALRRRLGPAPTDAQPTPLVAAPPAPSASDNLQSNQAFELVLDLPPEPDTVLDPAIEPKREPSPEPSGSDFWAQAQQQWMVWLGGACVALAGIFLAKYSIEQGLLGPTARVAAGVLTGLGLHAAAFWLRSHQGNHPAFAALAGGGSITVFAALLAALHFYQMFTPLTVFLCLALVAMATLWLALLHGPVLAAIGMLGAYSVPLLVSTGSGNILLAMLYALIISASVLGLLRYVYRPWLWWGMVAGSLLWWLISLTSQQPDGWRCVYLLVLAYGLVAMPGGNWLLRMPDAVPWWPLPALWRDDRPQPLFASLALVVAATGFTVWHSGWQGSGLVWLLVPVFLLYLAHAQPRFTSLAWLAYLLPNLALLLAQVQHLRGSEQWFIAPLASVVQADYLLYLGLAALVAVAMAVRNLTTRAASSAWAAMAATVPVLQLLQGYLLASDYTALWQWSIVAFALGAFALWLAFVARQRDWAKELVAWLLLAGHFAYTLIAVWLLDEASLTLAIAAQLVSLAWVMRDFDMPSIGWLFKLVAVLVVVRLTLNPWLAGYGVSGHWTLWTYGGATLCCALATRWLTALPQLARWSEAAALHLFVLTVWTEARYWLHDANPYSTDFTFVEATLNQMLFSALAVVYHIKSLRAQRLAMAYRYYGRLLLAFALFNYILLLGAVCTNAAWAWASVGEQPVFNLVLLAYGLPVALAWLIARYYEASIAPYAKLFAALAAWVFISLEIRHLWQGSIALAGGVENGEMYSYSAAWLVCAVAALLGGSWRFGRRCYQAGMALLALVIVKIFLIDMAGLEGLWRVASFMGLGLALLGVAFLHQKIQQQGDSAGLHGSDSGAKAG